MKVLGWLTHSEKNYHPRLRLVSGDNFFPRVLIYPNTFIQGQYVYNMITLQAFIGKQTSS